MKLRALGCYGGNIRELGMTSFLVNDTLALDAGWVSSALSLREQERVKDILISHSHLDHTCTLPFLIDNNFTAPGFSLRIYAIPEVIASMRSHLFNNHTWPDFTCLPNDLTPVLRLVEIHGAGRRTGRFNPDAILRRRGPRAGRPSERVPLLGIAARNVFTDSGRTHNVLFQRRKKSALAPAGQAEETCRKSFGSGGCSRSSASR